MLFDLSANSGASKIMELDPNYPEDVTLTYDADLPVSPFFLVRPVDTDKVYEATFQWYLDGNSVENETSEVYSPDCSEIFGVHTVYCIVTQRNGTTSSRIATLTVKQVPTLSQTAPENKTVTIGKSEIFSVVIEKDGYPATYNYQWYVNGTAIEGATNATFTRVGSSVGTENIFCAVTNEAGTVQSVTATLTVSPEYIVYGGQFVDGGYWNKYLNADENSAINISGGSVHMYVNSSGTARVWTNQQYDFTGKNTLNFNCNFDTANGASGTMGVIYFGACDTQNNDSFIAQIGVSGHDGSGETITVDVSNISGLHYLKIVMVRATNYSDTIVTGDIWFG